MRIWLRRVLWTVAGVFLLALITGIYHTNKALPPGVSFDGPERVATSVRFLRDLTFVDADGNRRVEQQIFDAVFEMIDQAEQFILIDMFLYNEFQGAKPETTRALCDELTGHLVARKSAKPEIEIHVITDPINTVYGGMESKHLERLKDAGINVTVTDLSKLRDSNALYSSFWRLFIKPLGNSEGSLVQSPFGEGRVSLRSYFSLINFKANHRKSVVADGPEGLVGLVTSANPHDGSSAHENVALRFSGKAAADLLEAEAAVLAFSGGPEIEFDANRHRSADGFVRENSASANESGKAEVKIRIVSESKIQQEVIRLIETAKEIDLVMFYLSDREVIRALKESAKQGTAIRLILDSNKDAFGHQKGGVPNRQVASELRNYPNIEIRWADTHGEQCHSKMLLARDGRGGASLLLGSANYTRRNLDDLNLELDASVSGPADAGVFRRAREYFEMAWNNSGDRLFTTGYESYRDDSSFKKLQYRIMERTGLCTF